MHDIVGDHSRIVRFTDIGEEDNEFITSLPADRVVFADALGQPLGNLLQKTVADGMSECIVDVFEFIEIEEHDGLSLIHI